MMARLLDYDYTRYHRQMLIPGWGEEEQKKVKASRVFVAGAGGLGSPVAIYLAIAGVGEITICDADTVELSNLNRQILHADHTIGKSKAVSAKTTLEALNPEVNVVCHAEYLDERNIEQLVGRPDVVVDCLDNFETRYLLNAYCVKNGIPFVHAGVWGLMGQVTFLSSPQTPCLRCIFPQAPPQETFPVLGATPGIIGCIQAMEVLKYLTGVGDLLYGKLLVMDGSDMKFSAIEVKRSPSCPECGHKE